MSKKKIQPKPAAAAPPVEKETVFEKLYFWFFLLLPIIYTTRTLDPVLVPRQIFVSVFVVVIGGLLLARFAAKKTTADWSFLRLGIFPAAALFLLAIVVSFLQAHLLSESIYTFSRILIEVLFFLLTTFLIVQGELRLKILIKALLGMAVILLVIAIYQLFTLDMTRAGFSENTYNVQSSIAHKNLFASLLFLLFPFLCIAIAMKSRLKALAVALLVIGIVLLWLLQARTVLVALIVAGSVYAFLALRYRLTAMSAKSGRTALITGAVALVVVVFVTWRFRDTFSHLFYTESVYERIGLWENTVKMIERHPVTGVGAGNWQIWFPEGGLDRFGVERVKMGLTTFQRPHNDLLWIWSETGIVGILAYLAVFGFGLFYLVRLLKRTEERAERQTYAILFATILGYLVIALLDFPLERIEHQLVIWLLLALTAANYFRKRSAEKKALPTKIPVYVALLGAAFSLYVAFYRASGERHMQKLYGAQQLGDWNGVIAEADQALNPLYEVDATSVPVAWYKGVAYFTLEDFSQAKQEFERANRVHPYNIHVMNNLASCYEKLGQHNQAIRYYRKALSYSSAFEEPRLNLSAVYFNTGKYEEAFRTIDACDTATRDPKYRIFLPAILGKKIEQQQSKLDPLVRERLDALKTNNEALMSVYFSAKRTGTNFDHAVLSKLNGLNLR